MQKIPLKDFQSIEKGSKVMYMGSRHEVLDNNGAILTLKEIETGEKKTVNFNMFNHGGAIHDHSKDMNESKDEMVTLNVSISNIDQSTAADFLKMFAFMEYCGNVGTARTFRGFLDGDGHFRPSIKVEGVDLKKIDLGLEDKDKEIDLDLDFGA